MAYSAICCYCSCDVVAFNRINAAMSSSVLTGYIQSAPLGRSGEAPHGPCRPRMDCIVVWYVCSASLRCNWRQDSGQNRMFVGVGVGVGGWVRCSPGSQLCRPVSFDQSTPATRISGDIRCDRSLAGSWKSFQSKCWRICEYVIGCRKSDAIWSTMSLKMTCLRLITTTWGFAPVTKTSYRLNRGSITIRPSIGEVHNWQTCMKLFLRLWKFEKLPY